MVAAYTIKINDRYYKAGEIIPDIEEADKVIYPKEVKEGDLLEIHGTSSFHRPERR